VGDWGDLRSEGRLSGGAEACLASLARTFPDVAIDSFITYTQKISFLSFIRDEREKNAF